ncbi:hypothetical protein JCM10908_007228 [Rhodotorula pacifica]|uniref:uncharacterized protein n=1 Tax=Rhodotorula pacifica TaxID=1495444 RepID=UPI003171A6A8
MNEEALRKLHGLYQVIEPPHDQPCERAFVCLSQLHRKPPSKRATSTEASGSRAMQGELEWVVGLAGPGKADPEAKGKKREPSDEWWMSSLSLDEVADWLDEANGPDWTPTTLLSRLRLAWQNGELHVKGYAGPGADPRMGLELEARLGDALNLSLVLSPCSSPPLSLEQVLIETIPAFNRQKALPAAASRSIGSAPVAGPSPAIDYKEKYDKLLQKADKLVSDKSRLESELAVLREHNKRARKQAKRNNSGEGASAYGGPSGSPSPTKPAVPGGYAGNRTRAGRITQEADFDPVSDSD